MEREPQQPQQPGREVRRRVTFDEASWLRLTRLAEQERVSVGDMPLVIARQAHLQSLGQKGAELLVRRGHRVWRLRHPADNG